MPSGVTEYPLAARLTALALFLAVLCNGASVYLKRTGLLEGEAYRAYWAIHCTPVDPALANALAEPRCCASATPGEIALHDSDAHIELEETFLRYVFEVSGSGLVLKLVKDLLGLTLILFSALVVLKRAAPVPRILDAWPVMLLTTYALMAFFVSLIISGPLVAVAGLRAFMFAMIALLAQWLAPRLEVIARSLGALLVLQALLVLFELFRGVHLYGEWGPLYLASRVSGTMVMPNSLGIFSVTALAFIVSFSTIRAWLPVLSAATLVAVFFSGSGTGIFCFGLLVYFMLAYRNRDDRRVRPAIGSVLAGVISVFVLLMFSLREGIFDSLLGEGRLGDLISVLSERSLPEVIFGSGLGTGMNGILQLQDHALADALGDTGLRISEFTDSTIAGLAIEIGLLGAALFYAALIWAGMRDRAARPFYWVVGLCTLTVNVTVMFPVNFLLGLAWAHSIWTGRRQ